MAKKTRPQGTEGQAPASPAAQPAGRIAIASPDTEPKVFSVKQYALMNVIFDVFCVIQLALVEVVVKETRGLYFFFGLLMLGFLLVSIFDYLYDHKIAPRTQ